MLNVPLSRCSRLRHLNGVVVATNCKGCNIMPGLGHTRNYAKDTGSCPDAPQTDGKKVESWPKSDPPPPAWRCECPKEPQPPNYDPYRIKVPDVVVPPLPTSNAKWSGVVFAKDQEGKEAPHPEIRQPAGPEMKNEPEPEPEEKEEEPEGFFAGLKSYFGFGKNKKGDIDRCVHERLAGEVPSEDGREPFKSVAPNLVLNANMQDLFYDSPIVHPDYWKDKTKKVLPNTTETRIFSRLGYHGKSKYKYAFHEPWKPLDRLTLIAQAEKEEGGLGVSEAAEEDKQVT